MEINEIVKEANLILFKFLILVQNLFNTSLLVFGTLGNISKQQALPIFLLVLNACLIIFIIEVMFSVAHVVPFIIKIFSPITLNFHHSPSQSVVFMSHFKHPKTWLDCYDGCHSFCKVSQTVESFEVFLKISAVFHIESIMLILRSDS